MKTALMSIHEEYALQIFAKTKKFEFRRRAPRLDTPFRILIYVPGRRKLAGEAHVWTIIQGAPSTVWRKTRKNAGISKAAFDAYFAGRDVAYALALRKVTEYQEQASLESLRQTVPGGFHPPQYLQWLGERQVAALVE